MSDQSAVQSDSAFRVPTNAHELAALGLALLTVFALIQVGAPIMRELDFLDEKLRDYFIGISFVAFPVIHRGYKRGLARMRSQAAPVQHDLAPWFVSGVIAAALLFAWNQFVSFLGGISTGLVLGQLAQGVNLEHADTASAVILSIMAVSLPLSAVAAVFAGVQLNRHTRSHTFAALGLASLFFVVFNAGTNWLFQPDMVAAQFAQAAAQGPEGVVGFVIGLFLVGFIIFVFGCIGIVISRINRERSIGNVMEAARRLSPAEREVLAAEIARRLEASAAVQMPGTAVVRP